MYPTFICSQPYSRLFIRLFFFAGMLLTACGSFGQPETAKRLIRVSNAEESAYGYINQSGDTIVPIGHYDMCFTDTALYYAAVYGKEGCLAIDLDGKELFGIYWFDNGPDYLSEGLFRMTKDGKVGYADEKGVVVIAPVFACAGPFEGGRAQVAHECTKSSDGEHTSVSSEAWFFINAKGEKIGD